MKLQIPGNPLKAKNLVLFLALFFIFAISFGLAYFLESPEMLGKREACYKEVYSFSILAFLLLIPFLRKALSPRKSWHSLFIGFSIGMTPAILMQIFCMKNYVHALEYHMFPGLLIGVLSSFCILMVKKQRGFVD